MSIRALDWALTVKAGNTANKIILLLLADRHNPDEDSAWPSVGWLATQAEMSRRTVQRSLRDLEHRGLIVHCGWVGVQLDRQTKRYRLPVDNTGRHSDTRCHTGTTGRHTDRTGRHSDALTVSEPLGTSNARNRRKPVDNLTRPPVPSPEETQRMLEEERA